MTSNEATFRICVLPGDGIGTEIMEPCLAILNRACQKVGGISLENEILPAGAACYAECGEALPTATLDAARQADAILLAAMGDPAIRYDDGTEITPQIEMRDLSRCVDAGPAHSAEQMLS